MRVRANVSETSRFAWYEQAVQSPDVHLDFFEDLALELRGRPLRTLREDFCGTFALCRRWVARGPDHEAVGVDLDPEPLAYGRARLASQPRDEAQRVSLVQADVCAAELAPVDLIAVCNYSFWLLHTKAALMRYLRAARRGLGDGGLLVLESLAGRPAPTHARAHTHDDGTPWFTYTWELARWDRKTRRVEAALSFRDDVTGAEARHAFAYAWRFWRLGELRPMLRAAGFGAVGVVHAEAHGVARPIYVVAQR